MSCSTWTIAHPQGYGRDWRTAIYRQMGHPELEDLLDGKKWLAEHASVDPKRVGVYGGSYGGFMTLMALFRAPGEFAAGAALRPVTDWMQYEHDYTSAILNEPQIDPIAYARSSPIEFADGLRDPLLICHGVIDDNVLFEDSMRLYQRLIELHKDDFTISPYPLDRHGFSNADSWLDEYKRIYRLFETHLEVAGIRRRRAAPRIRAASSLAQDFRRGALQDLDDALLFFARAVPFVGESELEFVPGAMQFLRAATFMSHRTPRRFPRRALRGARGPCVRRPGRIGRTGIRGAAIALQVLLARVGDVVELAGAVGLDGGVADFLEIGEGGVDHAGART